MHRNIVRLTLAVATLSLMIGHNCAQAANVIRQQTVVQTPRSFGSLSAIERMRMRVTPSQRRAAAVSAATRRSVQSNGIGVRSIPMPMPMPGGTPNYFGPESNWANSPLPTVNLGTGAISGGIRKFVDSLPRLGAANTLGQMIPIAVKDISSYPGSDYYEIGLVEYSEKLHSDLPATKLRGYVQLNDPAHPVTRDPVTGKITAWPQPQYLGPMIIARRDRPVRVKFTNLLPTGNGGNLFLPVDTTVMGAGMGPVAMKNPDGSPMLNPDGSPMMEFYTQNRGTLHLHGGNTPWISDGTPHQWTTPAGEDTSYPKGVSVRYVPDMFFDTTGNPVSAGTPGATNDPGPGSMTFYYTNNQGARLMWYHDHSYGLTRLNVYAGEAAGYLLQDTTEDGLVASGVIPADQIPLIIQDRTFVDAATVLTTDPTWNWGSTPGTPTTGDLWFPHVYMPNQWPDNPDGSGTNPFGRWDYGPWFWPPLTADSGLKHGPVTLSDGTEAPGTPNPSMAMESFMDTPLVNGTVYPYVVVQPKAYRFRILNACNERGLNLQLYYAKSNASMWKLDGTLNDADAGEVAMVPAIQGIPGTAGYSKDETDGRDGGVPDTRTAGPQMIQIGTEGGFLRTPAVLPNMPVGYNYNRRDIVVLNVSNKTLFLGPAERADVIVDFSGVPVGSKLILYNDAPAPIPAFDPRFDYYTGDVDQTSTGGAPPTLAGYGPNIRTIMQFQVSGTPAPQPYNMTALNAALPVAFAASQPPMIVPEVAYGASTNTYSRIQSTALTYTPTGTSTPITVQMQPKAIQELFELDYGRMNSTLGVELPFTNFQNQTTIPLGYIDPPTEVIKNGETQIWKITHNGVDTHAIHVHLFNVQLINRVGWDGAIRPPDANELGWKETIRMNPLEDAIVALRPIAASVPFAVPDSIRPFDPTMPLGSTFQSINPTNNTAVTVVNDLVNFGNEYMWHCHMLGHEEMDMMRPIVFLTRPDPPTSLAATVTGPLRVHLTWAYTQGSIPATNIRIERAAGAGAFSSVGTVAANVRTFNDSTVADGTSYSYRVIAYTGAFDSDPSNIATVTLPLIAPSGLAAALQAPSPLTVNLTWVDGSIANTGYAVQRATNSGFTTGLVSYTVAPGTATAFLNNTTLAANTTYYYRVRSTLGVIVSAWSSTAQISTGPPTAPTNLTANASLLSTNPPTVTLGWRDNSTNESGFTIQRATNVGFTADVTNIAAAANSTSYVDATVVGNTRYWYRVRAVNVIGVSGWSNTVNLSPGQLPLAPTHLVVGSLTSRTALLTWTDVATNETGYTIQAATNAAFTTGLNSSAIGANATSFTVTRLERGRTYWFRVFATNAAGSSASSNVVTGATP